jgi:hypothetical protein
MPNFLVWCSFWHMHQYFQLRRTTSLVHNGCMRTSVTLDDDAYQLASLYAAGRGITLSAAINEAVRKIGEPPSASGSPQLKIAPNGLLVFASRGRVITSEMVKAAQEDEID